MPWEKTSIFKMTFYLCVVHQCRRMCHSTLFVARPQPTGIGSLFPPCGSSDQTGSSQACCRVLSYVKLSSWPGKYTLTHRKQGGEGGLRLGKHGWPDTPRPLSHGMDRVVQSEVSTHEITTPWSSLQQIHIQNRLKNSLITLKNRAEKNQWVKNYLCVYVCIFLSVYTQHTCSTQRPSQSLRSPGTVVSPFQCGDKNPTQVLAGAASTQPLSPYPAP